MTEHALDLETLLSDAQLPALPRSALQLLSWTNESEVPPVEFAAPIEADPGLAGQVLKFVNSSYFGFSRDVSNIKLAISLVGARTIKNFVLWSAVFSLTPGGAQGEFDVAALWKDSLYRGLFARAFAKLLKLKEAEEAFAAALLQDMSLPLLVKALPTEYANIFQERRTSGRRLSAIESERFGWNHAEAAAFMARRWKLPPSLADLVANHARHELLLADAEAVSGLQLAVSMSSLLPSMRDEPWTEREAFDAAYALHAPEGAPEAAELFDRLDEAFREFAPTMKLAGANRSLGKLYRESPALADG